MTKTFNINIMELYSYFDQIKDPKIAEICHFIISDPNFVEGYGSTDKHHSYISGLLDHTLEVMKNAFSILNNKVKKPNINKDHLICAVYYHDYAKIFDYELKDDKIVYTKHKSMIGHISKSYTIFMSNAQKVNLPDTDKDLIGHSLLAHHGQLLYGSPVVPLTSLARLLHVADMASAYFDIRSPGVKND